MYTEEEAEQNWCPMVRYSANQDDNNSANRWREEETTINNPEQACCIASDCMMWRWSRCPMINVVDGKIIEMDPGKEYHKKGYCGLGGKP